MILNQLLDRARQQQQAERLAARQAAAAHRQGVAAARQAARQAARHDAALARHAAQVQRHEERLAGKRRKACPPPWYSTSTPGEYLYFFLI